MDFSKMNKIGFSTGALAYGDFRRGIELQRCAGVEAIELSALREHELLDLLDAIGKLDLSSFAYRSFHAPSALREMTPIELIERLRPVAAMGLPIIVHPDVLGNDIDACAFLAKVCYWRIWTSESRYVGPPARCGRSSHDFQTHDFVSTSDMARQIDPTMSVAVEMLLAFPQRIAQLHISEVDWECRHRRISSAAAIAFQSVARWIPHGTPVIIESIAFEDEIDRELAIVRRCLDPSSPIFGRRAERQEPMTA